MKKDNIHNDAEIKKRHKAKSQKRRRQNKFKNKLKPK